MVELGTDPAAGDGIRPWVTTRGVTRVVAIVAAVSATALWMNVAWGNRNPYSRSGIGAMTFTSLLAVMLPLALRADRASRGTHDDGARITAVAAAALLVIGTVAYVDHYAVAARFADGTRGTLEVESAFCEQTCEWSGFFWVRHGPHGKLVLKRDWGVTLADAPGLGPKGLNGFTIPAIDVSDPNQVYLPGGGPQWAQVNTVTIADSATACSLIAAILLLRYRRSRRHRRINVSLALVPSPRRSPVTADRPESIWVPREQPGDHNEWVLYYRAIYTHDLDTPKCKPLSIFVTDLKTADALRWDQRQQAWQYAPDLVYPFISHDMNWDRIKLLDRAAAEEYSRQLAVDGSSRSELPDEEWIEWFFAWKGDPPDHEDPTWDTDAHVRQLRAEAAERATRQQAREDTDGG